MRLKPHGSRATMYCLERNSPLSIHQFPYNGQGRAGGKVEFASKGPRCQDNDLSLRVDV